MLDQELAEAAVLAKVFMLASGLAGMEALTPAVLLRTNSTRTFSFPMIQQLKVNSGRIHQ
jgi:hypothetical protein